MVGTIWGNARILALGLVLSMSLTGCLEETRKSTLTPDNTPVAPSSRPGIPAPHTSPSSPGIPAPATPPSTSGGNIEPQIRGEPARIAVVGEVYEFQPEATDADGDRLTFSISGKPSWAAFDSDSGRLRGTPRDGDLGEAPADVVVRVTDGVHTKAWPKFRLAVAPQRKANYGHYFATRYSDTPADVAMLCEQAGVSGVVWRETWKDVEPSAGVYDFSGFDSVLAEIARSHNPQCQVWLFIEYKSFRNSVVKNPCPVYLQAAHSGLNADGNGAVTCFMWEPVMVQAYAAMMQAAAARFDANPRVEGLIFQESALGFNGAYSQDVADGGTYTPEAWRDALVDLIAQCGSSFLQSRCMAFMNFIRGKQAYLYDISAALAAVPNGRGCLSGPDLLPNSQPLYDTTSSVYEVLVRHDGCRSNSAQNDSYNVSGCGVECIFRFAVSGTFGDFDAAAPRTSGLCINSYLFWNHTVVRSSTGLDWTNALPVIAAYPYGKSWYEQCSNGGGAP